MFHTRRRMFFLAILAAACLCACSAKEARVSSAAAQKAADPSASASSAGISGAAQSASSVGQIISSAAGSESTPGSASSRAAAEPAFQVSDASGAPGDSVTVTVSMQNNPGIIGAALRVGYDADKLELTHVRDEQLLADPSFGESCSDNPYYLSWNDALAGGNTDTSGPLAELTFRIKEGCAPGRTQITLSFGAGDVFDWNLQSVAFQAKNGTLTITEKNAEP
jgi:hypothetical protein